MKKICQKLLFASSLVLSGGVAHGIALDTDSSNWDAITYSDSQSDYWDDQQTGQGSSDIVGSVDNSNAGFFKQYDTGVDALDLSDDTLAFRIRLAEDDGPQGMTKYAFVGLDVGGDGTADVFIRARDGEVSFFAAGPGLNISPNTSTLQALTSANQYNGEVVDWEYTPGDSNFNLDYSAVNTIDIAGPDDVDGGGADDYFLSFSVDVATLLKAIAVSATINNGGADPAPTFDLESGVSFIAATSVNGNNLNQDIGGVPNLKGVNLDDTWAVLGAKSDTYTPDGATAVPEPTTSVLLLGLCAGALVLTRRRR